MANTETSGFIAEQEAAAKLAAARRRSLSSVFGHGRILLYQILLIAGFLLLWEVAVRYGWIKVYLYGQPSGIWRELVKGLVTGSLLRDTWVTTQETVIGFVIGSVLGSVAGLLLWLSPTAAAVLRPLMVALNGLPKIALAPLIIVWFGIGMESKVAVAAIITFIVAMITSFAGSQEIDTDFVRMLKAFGASRFQIFRMVILPGSLPWIASAFRLNIGFAMIGAVVGEYISAEQGLGYYVYYSGTLYNLNAVWGGIVALMLLALALDAIVGWIERRDDLALAERSYMIGHETDVVLRAQEVGMTFNQGAASALTAIADINFELHKGEVVAIVGPSGCGKSTLFNIIAGLLEPTRGHIEVNGKQVHRATGHVGYMLQKDLLLPWRTVIENVTIGLEVRKLPRKQAEATARALIEAYGLKEFENVYPSALSGGMRQRVAFMRTLAFSPDVILLDEPFSALDSQTRMLLQADVLRIIRDRHCSVVLVTHDVGEAITMADRIVVITSRPGRVKTVHQVGIAPELRHPLKIRKLPRFVELYEAIWVELGVDIAA